MYLKIKCQWFLFIPETLSHSDSTVHLQALCFWNTYLHLIDTAPICTYSSTLSHKVMYFCFPSLTPVSTVIGINNSRLIHLVFLCGMILFVREKAWLSWLILNVYPDSLCSIVSPSQAFPDLSEGKLCLPPSDCVSTCGLTEKLKRAEYKQLMSRDLGFSHLLPQ